MAPKKKYEEPHTQLGRLLREARDEGLGFEAAWLRAVRQGLPVVMTTEKDPPHGAIRWPSDPVAREEWQHAIYATRSGWREAYQRDERLNPVAHLDLTGVVLTQTAA